MEDIESRGPDSSSRERILRMDASSSPSLRVEILGGDMLRENQLVFITSFSIWGQFWLASNETVEAVILWLETFDSVMEVVGTVEAAVGACVPNVTVEHVDEVVTLVLAFFVGAEALSRVRVMTAIAR